MILYTIICCAILLVIGWAGLEIFNSIGLNSSGAKGSWKRGVLILILLVTIPLIVLTFIGYFGADFLLDKIKGEMGNVATPNPNNR